MPKQAATTNDATGISTDTSGGPLVETWRIHNRIMLYVLAAVDGEALKDGSGLKGRTVGEQFAHLHNVRLMWLKSAAPDLLDGLTKIERDAAYDRETLRTALEASGEGVATMITRGAETGRVKGFKPHPTAFVAYLVAHESYHQGDIGVRLTAAGHPLDQKTAYGMFEWGSR